MANENLPNINANLDLKITDFLLLQEISEMKLNRYLGQDNNGNDIRFYNSYKNNINNEEYLRNQFYTTIGSNPNLTNTNSVVYLGGAGAYTKIPKEQADYFLDNYDIVDYYGNDNTGFSATTFKNKYTGEITISCRSTEFKEDYYKDAYGAGQEISNNGTAIAQNISLVNYLEHLKSLKTTNSNGDEISLFQTSKLNITGYSLGGHLASSAYQYLKSEGYSNLQLYVFNGLGVGNVSAPNIISNTTTENFGYLKQDLLNYNNIINMFDILKLQNIDNEDDAKNFVDQNSNNQLTKEFFHSFSSIKYLSDLIKKNLNNTLLNTSRLNLYDITTNSYIAHENELEKSSHISQNDTDSYLETTIYGNDLYKAFQDYIKFKYHLSKAGIGGQNNVNPSNFETLIQAAQSEKTGIQDNFLFGSNALWINGQSTVNNYDFLSNDFNFVANSNRYANPVDIVIEDRPETEDGISRIPAINSITQTLNGDFGNTHSITLLNKSLNLMATLAKLEGKNSIDVAKYSSIISSASKERATHFYLSEDGSNGTGDSNAISNVINTLSDLLLSKQEKQLIPFDTNINFDNSLGGWADINKINQLTFIEKKLINKTSNIKLVSFYNIKNEDLSRSQFNQTSYEYIKKEDLIQKAKINVAYRYALDKLNTFAIEDADYSNYKDSEHSEEWYSSRADVLLRIIDSNVENLNNYVSSSYTNDKPTQIFTNIYVNDNQQDLHFYSSVENKNVNYKTYNQNSYYYKSQTFNTISSLDSSLLNTLIKTKDDYLSKSDYQALSIAANTFFKVAIARNFPYPYIGYKTYNTIKNYFPNISIDGFDYFKNSIIEKESHKLIGNMTNRQSLSINNNIYFLDNSTSNYKSNNYKNKNENVFINVNKDLLFSYLNGDSTFDNQYFNNINYELKNGLFKPNTVDDIKLKHDINLGDGDDYLEIDDDGIANVYSTSGKKNYYLKGSKTYITDPNKSGTITLDGILLTGGDMVIENGFVDSNKRVQIYYSDTELDELGNPKAYKITYQFNIDGNDNNYYHILNEKTGHEVIIPDLSNFGNGVVFGFKSLASSSFVEQKTFSQEDFHNTFSYYPNIGYINKNISTYYDSSTDFEELFNINININEENMVFTRNPDNKKDLIVYDKTNPHNIYTIADFFDELGILKEHVYYVVNGDTNSMQFSHFKINHSELSVLLFKSQNKTMTTDELTEFPPENVAKGYSGYELNTYFDIVLNYSPYAKYFIDNALISSTGFRKEGNDLVLYHLNFEIPQFNGNYIQKGKNIIKNYFAFDHSQTTNFYVHRYGKNFELSPSDLIKRMAVRLDEKSSNYIMDENSYKTVISGLGNDTIVGTSDDETFISGSIIDYDWTGFIGHSFSDGNDTFTGGGGADIYSFSDNFGYDTITDFNNDSTIYIDNSNERENYQFLRDGNDLIIYKELNTTVNQRYSQLTIKNYFNTIDYQNNSRIIFTRNEEHREQFYNDSNYVPETYYYFDSSEIQNFNTTDLSKTNDEVLEQKAKDISNNSIDTSKLSTSHIRGNDLDNTIIIRNNDTVIHSNQTSQLTDGDDTYIIEIADTEALNPNHNLYRTTIQFGYNSGHDSLFNATFKETNQYGDIIELVNINSQSITINKIQNESNILVGFNVILSDGSSIAFTFNDFSNSNIDVIKTNDKVIKLSELLTMASPNVISGDSLNNSFDLSSLDKSVNIKGMDGNDLIKGSKADDSIEGGNGFDQYNFSGGLDTYVFNQNCDIDTFNVNSISDSDINTFSANFLIDSSFKNNVSYLFNEKESEAYLKFSDTDGVVFTNVTWGKFINLINNINIKFTDNTTKSINVSETENFPFVKTSKIINGTTGSDYLQTNSLYSFVVYGKDGNDTIVSNGGTNTSRNFLFGGKGNDTITANDGDMIVVKDGDGTDIIKTTDRSFVLEILHNTPRLVNSKETLFDVSAVSGTNDIKLKYGGSTDVITIKDYFASTNNEVSIALYDSTNDKTYVYDDLDNILSTLKITKSSLLSKGAVTVYKTAVTADIIGNNGQLLGGELTAQYLAGNYLQDTNKISHIIDNQINGQPLQNKVYS